MEHDPGKVDLELAGEVRQEVRGVVPRHPQVLVQTGLGPEPVPTEPPGVGEEPDHALGKGFVHGISPVSPREDDGTGPRGYSATFTASPSLSDGAGFSTTTSPAFSPLSTRARSSFVTSISTGTFFTERPDSTR